MDTPATNTPRSTGRGHPTMTPKSLSLLSKFEGTLRIKYISPGPTWHQMKAGHTYSGSIICEHTYDEHVAFINRRLADNDRVSPYILDAAKCLLNGFNPNFIHCDI